MGKVAFGGSLMDGYSGPGLLEMRDEYLREQKAGCRYLSSPYISIPNMVPELFQLPTLVSALIFFL